ncbi:16S rRNA (adenine(1518)-N(6)/adenine(1519)-N(6))-dimethyltransferase RsmA [Candidatus Phytoplasma pini]|uniref:Ribosomal RNA small subunit methyltransferase A n=1 Tax=Candidatus Phytoplasma pini TaxID=267362 RepID=A0A559KJ14_9MOLU|nr:16S rRNA (adenine(1518)-N(6)/adenine(1519)-N(6))-dimethyltransferase RsmA [Candidatus Phytoplasma pini]TVY12122.1 dimethyladenosine transferase [Candidatus Phytoplasma pini]TVY12125.1 dimethyladenosine transferase [Candidatus Phytoplasma pini]
MKNKHVIKKKYGQNFLNDLHLLKMIVDKTNLKNKNVVEIGPGKGSLTNFILPQAKKVLAYEIDIFLKPFLIFDNYSDKINIIYTDVLNRDLEKDFKHFFPEEEDIVLIGNLPYYLTTVLLSKILFLNKIKIFTVLIQKEVALRILSTECKKNYGSLSVIMQSLTKIEKIKLVKKDMFYPKPKVDGMVLKFTKICFEKAKKDFLQNEFYTFVKASFKQKRKTLINNLSIYFCVSKEKLLFFFQKYQININIRAEQIDTLRFQKIAFLFYNFFQFKKKL